MRKLLLMLMLMVIGAETFGADFSITHNGNKLYFNVINKNEKTLALTFGGTAAKRKASSVKGVIEIPAKVKYNDEVYTVTGIGPKAFAGATGLTGIVMPSSIKAVGEFAFEGCRALQKIVFPGTPVTFGQGVFFKCPNISNVTIGSDWKYIDFTMFRWSLRLKEVIIPPKIEKIQGLKKLKGLTKIVVDPNNDKFSSDAGLLYSKDGKLLYACPRAFVGTAIIKGGTERVLSGAIEDCLGITSLDFPESLKLISFRETRKLKNLSLIILRSKSPIITGYYKGEGKFLFQLYNDEIKIEVPAVSKDNYIAKLATQEGDYSLKLNGVPYLVDKRELPLKKNIKGFKN